MPSPKRHPGEFRTWNGDVLLGDAQTCIRSRVATLSQFGQFKFRLLDALLLYEIVGMWLREEDPDIDFLNVDIITSPFERSLEDTLLRVVCEDFFFTCPQP